MHQEMRIIKVNGFFRLIGRKTGVIIRDNYPKKEMFDEYFIERIYRLRNL